MLLRAAAWSQCSDSWLSDLTVWPFRNSVAYLEIGFKPHKILLLFISVQEVSVQSPKGWHELSCQCEPAILFHCLPFQSSWDTGQTPVVSAHSWPSSVLKTGFQAENKKYKTCPPYGFNGNGVCPRASWKVRDEIDVITVLSVWFLDYDFPFPTPVFVNV